MTFFCEINIYLNEQLLEPTTLTSTANQNGGDSVTNVTFLCSILSLVLRPIQMAETINIRTVL